LKNETPHSLAIYVAGIVSVLLTLVVVMAVAAFFGTFHWLFPIVVFCTGFSVTYLSFRYTVNRFIYDKIKLVYKTIHQLKLGQKKAGLRKKIETGEDIIADVNREVVEWANDQSREIDDLKKMEAYRREFIGNLAHELKTPVFNIQGYISTLIDEEDPGDAEANIRQKYLRNTEKNIERMISLIQDLDTVSRLESGATQLDIERFDIAEMAREIMEMQEMRAKERNIRLQLKENYTPIYVMGDINSIKQVFTNLVVNSIIYGNEGGTTKISFYDMDENILTEVADDGPGISEEHLPRLFERFYRVDKSRSRNQGGTGLGLAIVKHIMEAHRQTINVRSKPGKGATFAFTLKKYKSGNNHI